MPGLALAQSDIDMSGRVVTRLPVSDVKKVEAELAAKNIILLEILIELNLFSFYGH